MHADWGNMFGCVASVWIVTAIVEFVLAYLEYMHTGKAHSLSRLSGRQFDASNEKSWLLLKAVSKSLKAVWKTAV